MSVSALCRWPCVLSPTLGLPAVEHCLLVFRAGIGTLEETQTPGPQPLLTFYLHREVLAFFANTATVDGTVQDLGTFHSQGMGVTQTGGLMPLTAADLHAVFEPGHSSHRGCSHCDSQDKGLMFLDNQRLPAAGSLRNLGLRLWF